MVNYGLVVGIPTPLKNDGVRQLGLLFPIYGKQHVPNHQPALYAWLPEREREGMGWVLSIYGSVFVHYVNDVWQINTFLGV